jgi:hypothetical protein
MTETKVQRSEYVPFVDHTLNDEIIQQACKKVGYSGDQPPAAMREFAWALIEAMRETTDYQRVVTYTSGSGWKDPDYEHSALHSFPIGAEVRYSDTAFELWPKLPPRTYIVTGYPTPSLHDVSLEGEPRPVGENWLTWASDEERAKWVPEA